MGIEIEAIRDDIKIIAEGQVMLNERFDRFESQYIRHHEVLSLYKLTFGELERRSKNWRRHGLRIGRKDTGMVK